MNKLLSAALLAAALVSSAAADAFLVLPATPDADPGYHTNLSLIDALAKGGI